MVNPSVKLQWSLGSITNDSLAMMEKGARGARDSLQEISDRTRIGVRQLKPLKVEQLDQLPVGYSTKALSGRMRAS